MAPQSIYMHTHTYVCTYVRFQEFAHTCSISSSILIENFDIFFYKKTRQTRMEVFALVNRGEIEKECTRQILYLFYCTHFCEFALVLPLKFFKNLDNTKKKYLNSLAKNEYRAASALAYPSVKLSICISDIIFISQLPKTHATNWRRSSAENYVAWLIKLNSWRLNFLRNCFIAIFTSNFLQIPFTIAPKICIAYFSARMHELLQYTNNKQSYVYVHTHTLR